MKILMVAIPNHHFFQWVNQLESSGYEVYWFDITDGGTLSPKIPWVHQLKGWKLKWDFPFRTKIKRHLPRLYRYIQTINERKVTAVFKEYLNTIQPDIVHCFEMQLAGLPILPVLEQSTVPLIYSSWGSDVYFYKELGVSDQVLQRFYTRVNYLITDCKRDYNSIIAKGYANTFLGVFPGNGGITINPDEIKLTAQRDLILIKGYDDGIGKAGLILEALALISEEILQSKQRIVVYSADVSLKEVIAHSKQLQKLPIELYFRAVFIPNEMVLKLMGQSSIHVANSTSDGMPNALLEAMYMGAFPIQSNPGGVTEEVITDGKNGYLIADPLNVTNIAALLKRALKSLDLRKSAQDYNVNMMENHFNRIKLQSKIVGLYQTIDGE